MWLVGRIGPGDRAVRLCCWFCCACVVRVVRAAPGGASRAGSFPWPASAAVHNLGVTRRPRRSILLWPDRRTPVTGVIDLSEPFASVSSWAFVPTSGSASDRHLVVDQGDRPSGCALRCASVRRSSIRCGSRAVLERPTDSQVSCSSSTAHRRCHPQRCCYSRWFGHRPLGSVVRSTSVKRSRFPSGLRCTVFKQTLDLVLTAGPGGATHKMWIDITSL